MQQKVTEPYEAPVWIQHSFAPYRPNIPNLAAEEGKFHEPLAAGIEEEHTLPAQE
jgi:hypothetical protein